MDFNNLNGKNDRSNQSKIVDKRLWLLVFIWEHTEQK